MWASGARFEAKLNQYENDPTYSPQLSQRVAGELSKNTSNSTYTNATQIPNTVSDARVYSSVLSSVKSLASGGMIDTA